MLLPPEGSSTSSLNLESSWTDENALYICVLELKSTLCAHMSMVVVVASRFRAFVVLYNPHTSTYIQHYTICWLMCSSAYIWVLIDTILMHEYHYDTYYLGAPLSCCLHNKAFIFIYVHSIIQSSMEIPRALWKKKQ